MKKVLLLALAVLAALAGAVPAGATTALAGGGGGGGGARADGYTTTPPPSVGPQAGEVALGAFVGATRSTAGRHGAADAFKAGPGCSIRCITGGLAYGRGPDARLVVTTDTPATIRIAVSRGGDYYRQILGDPGQTSLDAFFDDLAADTDYDVLVTARDAAGHLEQRTGSFRTLQRNVEIQLSEAHISAAPHGDQPFEAEIWLEGQIHTDADAVDAVGGVLPLGIQAIDLEDTYRHLQLLVELTQWMEHDGTTCEVDNPYHPAIDVGPHHCHHHEVALFAGGSLDVDQRPPGSGTWNDYTIQTELVQPGGGALPGGYGSPLRFTVPVGVQVTWTHG